MTSRTGLTRRSFLAAGAALAAGPFILTGCATTQKRYAANDRINVGVIGVGRRGSDHLKLPEGAQVVAISDVNVPRMEQKKGRNDWRLYADYRDLLAQDDIDAVVIATPDHWHAINAVHACEAGKDVYVEKPMTLTVVEGRRMVEAARKHKRIVQCGSQQRSIAECRIGCEMVRNGRIGKVRVVHTANYQSPWECPLGSQPVPKGLDWDMWCGQTDPRPYHAELYEPRVRGHEAGWISYRPYSGGEMTGWGSHGLDMIQWALGTDETGPVEVWAIPGTEPADPVHQGPKCEVRLRYADGTEVWLDNKGPAGGGLFEGENGTVLIDRGKYEVTPKELERPLGAGEVSLTQSNDHHQNWLDCIRTRRRPIADAEIGHRSATLCHLGNIARWAMRPLKWDPQAECFVDDDEANSYLHRTMREPWVI